MDITTSARFGAPCMIRDPPHSQRFLGLLKDLSQPCARPFPALLIQALVKDTNAFCSASLEFFCWVARH